MKFKDCHSLKQLHVYSETANHLRLFTVLPFFSTIIEIENLPLLGLKCIRTHLPPSPTTTIKPRAQLLSAFETKMVNRNSGLLILSSSEIQNIIPQLIKYSMYMYCTTPIYKHNI